ncbi:MAG: VOC family protein [Pseudomonadota bacterium]
MTHYIPEGSHTVNSYITVTSADAAIAWYKDALGAEERSRLSMPDGGVMHAEIAVADSLIMLSDANAEWGTQAPQELATYTLCVYVPDCDAVFHRCVEHGAEELQPLQDQFWGDRTGKVRDPFGVCWMFMTHLEDVSESEMQSRFAAMMNG